MPNLFKIHILGEFKEGSWGGGNQFLKALKSEWQKLGTYEDSPEKAKYILFNSYQNLLLAAQLKRNLPEKVFIHRLGPIFHYHRGENWKLTDQLTLKVTKAVADLTIFQSNWSYHESVRLGFDASNYTIISNAVDPTIFNSLGRTPCPDQKVRLITTSWSANPNKGSAFLQYLDQHLNFSRYTMTFVGNTADKFKHIRLISPLDSSGLAQELKKHDIFIAPFRHEAASNAILEALACGLPVIALDSGSNREEIKKGGELFQDQKELLAKIGLVTQNYYTYQSHIEVIGIKDIAQRYLTAVEQIDSCKPPPPLWFYYYLKWKLK